MKSLTAKKLTWSQFVDLMRAATNKHLKRLVVSVKGEAPEDTKEFEDLLEQNTNLTSFLLKTKTFHLSLLQSKITAIINRNKFNAKQSRFKRVKVAAPETVVVDPNLGKKRKEKEWEEESEENPSKRRAEPINSADAQ